MRYGPALSPNEWQVRGLAPAAGGCGWTYDPSFRTNRDVKHTRSRREIIVGIIPHDLTNIRDDVSYHAYNTTIYLSFVI